MGEREFVFYANGQRERGMGRVRGGFLLVQWTGEGICWFSDRVHV
jgi:hypothetical protein